MLNSGDMAIFEMIVGGKQGTIWRTLAQRLDLVNSLGFIAVLPACPVFCGPSLTYHRLPHDWYRRMLLHLWWRSSSLLLLISNVICNATPPLQSCWIN
jgi:hypothetical protein